jgi:hypothetical protein
MCCPSFAQGRVGGGGHKLNIFVNCRGPQRKLQRSTCGPRVSHRWRRELVGYAHRDSLIWRHQTFSFGDVAWRTPWQWQRVAKSTRNWSCAVVPAATRCSLLWQEADSGRYKHTHKSCSVLTHQCWCIKQFLSLKYFCLVEIVCACFGDTLCWWVARNYLY